MFELHWVDWYFFSGIGMEYFVLEATGWLIGIFAGFWIVLNQIESLLSSLGSLSHAESVTVSNVQGIEDIEEGRTSQRPRLTLPPRLRLLLFL